MSKPYTSPTVKTLGTVQELTEQSFNKIGSTSDAFSPTLVGSLVPAP